MDRSECRIAALYAFAALVLLAVIYVIQVHPRENHGVFISEVCPHNNGVVYDSVGFYHDYIELKNSGSEIINLQDYGLSDDDSNLMKYVLPEIVLQSGESILIWADTESVYYGSAGSEFEDEESLYTEFGIRDHEMLFLTSPDGYVVDSIRIPAVKDNMALVRINPQDKGVVDVPKRMKNPEPQISEKIETPIFSAASGWYDKPFELTIDGHGNEVVYTVDGYDPYYHGNVYTKPIQIYDRSDENNRFAGVGTVSVTYEQGSLPPVSKCFVVRALCKSGDGRVSEEAVATYFIGRSIREICNGVLTLSLVSNPEGLFSDENGIYVPGNTWKLNKEKALNNDVDVRYAPANYNMRGKNWRRDAKATLFDENGRCLYDEDITINIRGGTSRVMLQKSFALKPKTEGQRVFDGLIPESGDSLDLRTGGEDEAFLTNFRDTLNSRIASNLRVTPQKSLCCQVYLNGEYWGCYNLQDHLNISFIGNRYDVLPSNINLVKNYEVVSGREEDYRQYKELEEFAKNNDFAVAENYEHFCEMVDIDSLIDYYCAQIYFANSDAYINNTALWKSRIRGQGEFEDCKWRFILFDTDESDSIFYDCADKDSFVEGNWMGVNPDTELYFSNLSNNPEFRVRFRERFRELLENDFSFERIEPIITQFENTYTDPMVRSVQRFGIPDFSREQYGRNVQTVRDFFRRRGEYISTYLTLHMGE